MLKTKSVIFILFTLLMPIVRISAQTLENIPGQTSVEAGDLTGYLENLYNFGIAITGILAVFMIVVGAFSYMVTSVGNPSKMTDAKEKITNALIGLIIALTAYLFLYVINPDLVSGTLTAPAEIVNEISSGSSSSNNSSGTLNEGDACQVTLSNGCIVNENASLCSNCPSGYDVNSAVCVNNCSSSSCTAICSVRGL